MKKLMALLGLTALLALAIAGEAFAEGEPTYDPNHAYVASGVYVESGSTHYQTCAVEGCVNTRHTGRNAPSSEKHDYQGGNCQTASVCTKCQAVNSRIDRNAHVYPTKYDGADVEYHWKICTVCDKELKTRHFNRKVTLFENGHNVTCATCNIITFADHILSDYTINADTHYIKCLSCTYELTEPHDYKNWAPAPNGCHTGTCVCGDQKTVSCEPGEWRNDGTKHDKPCLVCEQPIVGSEGDCAGGEATCLAKAICDTCKLPYGPEPAGHKWELAETIEASCMTEGLRTYSCAACEGIYTETIDNPGHHYGWWTFGGESMHLAECERCGYIADVNCGAFTYIIDDQTTLTVCPICGDADINGAAIAAFMPVAGACAEGDLPKGDLVILASENYYAVCVEFFGSAVALTAPITVAFPLELPAGALVTGIDADGAQYEIEYEYADGVIKFEIAAGGVFLIQ